MGVRVLSPTGFIELEVKENPPIEIEKLRNLEREIGGKAFLSTKIDDFSCPKEGTLSLYQKLYHLTFI